MKLNRIFPNLLIYGIAILYSVLEGYALVFTQQTGKSKTLNFIVMVPLIILLVALLARIRIQATIGFLFLLFWIPAGFLPNVHLFEVFLYLILFLVLANQFIHSGEEKIDFYISNYPWFPFVLYILGALITWSLATKTGGELDIIRAMCIIPLALSLVIGLTMQSVKDAEFYLWMILTSAAILGIFFLLGKNFFGFISLSTYTTGLGRLSMSLVIPRVGSLEMLPQSTSNWFGYLLVFAYSIWIFHPSSLHRKYAFFLCLLFGYIIITTQGRGGAIQAASGAALVSIYAAFNRKLFSIKGIGIKFAIVCLAVIGGLLYMAAHSTNADFTQRVLGLLTNPQSDATMLGRFKGWSDGIKLFLANPIFGIGLRGIQVPWGLDTSEVLNYFLYNLLSYGLLGFLGLMLVLLRLISTCWRGIHSGDRTTCMLCIASIGGMLGFFFGLQPDRPYSNVIVWAPLLIAFAASTIQAKRLVMGSDSINVMR